MNAAPSPAAGATHRSALAIARLVGLSAERALARHGSGLVLVSTARAGVPAGILMRRWFAVAHWLSVDHYAIGAAPEAGGDPVTMRWLTRQYEPGRIHFVDTWPGKGAIAEELRAGIGASGVPPDTFLDAVSAVFPAVAPAVTAGRRRRDAADAAPDG